MHELSNNSECQVNITYNSEVYYIQGASDIPKQGLKCSCAKCICEEIPQPLQELVRDHGWQSLIFYVND